MKTRRPHPAELLARIPLYASARSFGMRPPMPLSLSLCVTHRCNADCLTCDIASRPVDEMTLDEWRRAFHGIGRDVPWFTVTGGEPFLRDDMPDLLDALLEICGPRYVTIPTNASLPDTAIAAARVCRSYPGTRVVINISIDGPRGVHDRVRGQSGAFDAALETYNCLSNDKPPNLRVGIHTVISRHNVGSIPELVEEVRALNPDSHFFEIAQPRAELAMDGADLAPGAEVLKQALSHARGQLNLNPKERGMSAALVRAFRREYYRCLEASCCDGGRMPACYAGVASAYIAPDGLLTACPNRGEVMGSLRAEKPDFKKIWRSSYSARARRADRREDCRCHLANTAYTNLIFQPEVFIRSIFSFP